MAFNIDTKYMNYVLNRALSETMSIPNSKELNEYLKSTYNCDKSESHLVTRNGTVFELKRSSSHITFIVMQ